MLHKKTKESIGFLDFFYVFCCNSFRNFSWSLVSFLGILIFGITIRSPLRHHRVLFSPNHLPDILIVSPT